jgi:6-phosphogluconolactonase/glucosamine-6-phosphate isomerase/deaminase
MDIIRNPDTKKIQEEAAAALDAALFGARGGAVLLLLSGGSAFEILSGISGRNLGRHITVGMLDERFDDTQNANNFLQFQKTDFYKIAKDAGARFIDSVPKKNESLENFAERMEREWKNRREENGNGAIIITEGMGADGHTAGILPFPENPAFFVKLFLDDARWVRGYDAGTKNEYPFRATATLSFLKNEVDTAIAYIAGVAKKSAFEKLISETGTLPENPARIMREMKNVKLFTTLNVQ